MSWECPHYINVTGNCTRLEKICQPGHKGCVLEGKVRFISLEGNKRQEDDRYKPGERRYEGR